MSVTQSTLLSNNLKTVLPFSLSNHSSMQLKNRNIIGSTYLTELNGMIRRKFFNCSFHRQSYFDHFFSFAIEAGRLINTSTPRREPTRLCETQLDIYRRNHIPSFFPVSISNDFETPELNEEERAVVRNPHTVVRDAIDVVRGEAPHDTVDVLFPYALLRMRRIPCECHTFYLSFGMVSFFKKWEHGCK